MMETIKAFVLGMREFRLSFTTAYNEHEDHLLHAYDCGREWAHRLTLRRWEDR